ncbi:MAG: acyl-CoA dehydrogenase [Gammaproteobacteria bacterium]|jgi:acyl-CoA dehydrogenase|nr:acyl-CoA dehydrogenase [Gammaproteobacteria bacterium]MBT4194671.1 acyl-CoA dehydrogenase [Gammaproteobacteria bacterium]MBT4452316.1 acyl-CoA dehydrogenase [Gammaproteobacteria bacterium]MBT6456127.1 acyl-CoA dehydrogenase [Gammaproteobacteria bacterium]MBT6552592.1 acyl-CoA dehydrogenase [Gammaproteobacteria bacterium]
MNVLIFTGGVLALLYSITRFTMPFRHWALVVGGALALFTLFGGFNPLWGTISWIMFLAPSIFLGVPELRQRFLSNPLLYRIKKVLPPMSQTEKDAIESGTVWWEAELFRGNPNWDKLLKYQKPVLTTEEQAFVDGPVNELCAMIDDWDITNNRKDLPPEMWQFIKQNKFFGMIIPKKYGGLEFSALAHSEVVMKLSARSISVGVTVMVPNSLGPAELLQHYGTEQQKDFYLPRLADGREIPCFALTGPDAGSDAGSIPDSGVVCEEEFEGKKVLGLRLNWEKRYITLGPVSTVLGLAFKVYDPDALLGDNQELGITCALIPANLPGIDIGSRHFTLNAAFQNGPTRGKDVFIPLDYIIGGEQMIGKGWRMLVESLSVGRGISLPAVGAGSGKAASRWTGAYARIRKQFKTPIGRFEGVEEVLARIAGLSYFMDAGRLMTLSAIDSGEKPSVITAILKYHNTEKMRQVLNDSMDIHGGRGICMGPSNYIGRAYQTLPVGITVEGANILTRSMIIFGQGAIRCHPYLVREMEAAGLTDKLKAEKDFDAALTGHMSYFTQNLIRAFSFGLTGSHLAKTPVNGRVGQYYKRLAQMSAAFAVVSDLALMMLGGALKRKEKLSGRFADALSYMFYTSAILKKFEDDGRPRVDLPLVEWSAKYSLHQVQLALDEILRNFPNKPIGLIVRLLVFPLGLSLRQPNDSLSQRVAAILLKPGEARDRLTKGLYIVDDENDITGKLEVALKKVLLSDPIEKRLRAKKLIKPELLNYEQWLVELVSSDDISEQEAETLRQGKAVTRDIIMVDEFAQGELEAGVLPEEKVA